MIRRAGPWLALLLLAAPARAEDRRAEELFLDGQAALDRGDLARACTQFAASMKLTTRVAPLLNLAECEERRGRLLTALAHWEAAIAVLPKKDGRIELARKRVEALSRRIPRLTVRLVPEAPPGSKVTLDGAEISAAALGLPVPSDPGRHTLVASAPGHREARFTVELAEAETKEVVASPGPEGPSAPPPPPPADGRLRTAGFVVGGAGLASLVIGIVSGALTIAKKSTVDAHCLKGCDDTAREAATAGKRLSTISTVTFIAGGAGLATGLTLVLVSPSGRPAATVTAGASPGGGSLTLRGVF